MMATHTGKIVDVFNFTPKDVCIEDIAHALALINRFNGHSRFPISVAQHSVYVSRLCHSKCALDGLLHDASEAYVNDMNRWLKRHPGMEAYRELEDFILDQIFIKFELEAPFACDCVKRADHLMLRFEAEKAFDPDKRDYFTIGPYKDYFPPVTDEERRMIKYRTGNWQPWKWTDAEKIFLAEFRWLT